MNRKNLLIILLVLILVGMIGYTLYLHSGPYKRLSAENQQLKDEVKTGEASRSKMDQEIGRLKTALEQSDIKLAQKASSEEELQAKMGVLRETVSKAEGGK